MIVDRKRGMVERARHRLSIARQCRLLRINRSSHYYAPVPETHETLALMTVIDETFRVPVVWQPPDGAALAAGRAQDRSPSGAAADGEDGAGADLPAAAHERSAPAALGLSVCAAQAGDRAAQSCLVRRCEVHPMRDQTPFSKGSGEKRQKAYQRPILARLAVSEARSQSAKPRGNFGSSDPGRPISWIRGGVGGEGGIRTHGTVARTPHFECGAFDHSATSPQEIALQWRAPPGQAKRADSRVERTRQAPKAINRGTRLRLACFAHAQILYSGHEPSVFLLCPSWTCHRRAPGNARTLRYR